MRYPLVPGGSGVFATASKRVSEVGVATLSTIGAFAAAEAVLSGAALATADSGTGAASTTGVGEVGAA